MKRVISVIILVINIISLCSCKNSGKVIPVSSGLSFTASCSYNNENYNIEASIHKNKTAEFKFFFTDGSNSMIFKYSNNLVKLIYDSLEYEIPIDNLKNSSITNLLYYLFKDLNDNEQKIKFKDGIGVLERKVQDYDYKFYISQTGLPIKLIEKKYDIIIEFKNQSFLKE